MVNHERADKLINVETCRGCGRPLFIHKIANLVVRLEIDPLDAPQATQALIAGRELWRVTQTSLSPATPAVLGALHGAEPGERPRVVQQHACVPVSRPDTPSPVPGATDPKGGPQTATQALAAHSTRSSAPRTPRSGARRAESRRSDVAVPCSTCGKELDDPQTWIIIELGATVIDAFHTECPTQE